MSRSERAELKENQRIINDSSHDISYRNLILLVVHSRYKNLRENGRNGRKSDKSIMMVVKNMYLKHLLFRLPIEARKVVRRNEPEPRCLMYYEQTVLRFSHRTFRSHFRLTKRTFENLCQLLGPLMAPNENYNLLHSAVTPLLSHYSSAIVYRFRPTIKLSLDSS